MKFMFSHSPTLAVAFACIRLAFYDTIWPTLRAHEIRADRVTANANVSEFTVRAARTCSDVRARLRSPVLLWLFLLLVLQLFIYFLESGVYCSVSLFGSPSFIRCSAFTYALCVSTGWRSAGWLCTLVCYHVIHHP